MLIGAQLFTARNYLKDNEGIELAFKKAKETGYDCVQYSGAPDGGNFDPDFIKGLIDKYETPVYLTHIGLDRMKNNLREEIRKHKAIGCLNMGLGMLPLECLDDENKLASFVCDVKKIISEISSAGMKFFYHNHSIEFNRLKSGETLFDYLFRTLPEMNFTLDTHWVQRGGADVCETIKKCSGRIDCVHLKDYAMDKWDVKFASVGEGNLNWEKIMPALEVAKVKYAFVEEDDAPDKGEPFDFLAVSRKNLKKIGY